MFAFLPIVGSLISGVSTWLASRNELKMAIDKDDLEEIKTRLAGQRKDIRLQLQQDMIVFPTAAWTMLYVWDKIVALKYPDLVWGVAPIDGLAMMAILPTVVLAYLFGLAIRNKI